MEHRRRKAWILVALGALVVGAIGVVALAHRHEIFHKNDPYPWPEHRPRDLEARLAGQKVNLNFDQTPILEALSVLHELTNVEVRTSDGVKSAIQGTKLNLRVRDICVLNALDLMLAASPVSVTREIREGRIDLVLPEAVPTKPQPISVKELVAENGGWRQDYERKLASQHITCNFVGTPLSEVVEFLQDITGLNVTVYRGIDQEQYKITAKVQNTLLKDALPLFLPDGFHYELRRESLWITDQPVDTTSGLAKANLSLDLRGTTVSALVQELMKDNVETVATEEAWASTGTFSIVGTGELGTILAPLGSFGLRVSFVGMETIGREVVLIEGTVVHERDVLSSALPPYPGIAAEVAARRKALAPLLARRDDLREDTAATGDAVTAAEVAARREIRDLAYVIQRADMLARIPERRARAQAELDQAKAAGDRQAIARLGRELAWIEKGVPLAQGLEAGKRLADVDVDAKALLERAGPQSAR